MSAALERRLAAVMALDIVGYSRLMGLDEEGTHRRVLAFLDGTVRDRVTTRGGRIVKSTGDGALVEFGSVVEATRCALEIGERMGGHNHDVPPDRHIQVRIGINLGDIIIERDDIYGDGVNIAARLEALARPGTICVSEAVIGQIADKFSFRCEDLGYQSLKNIQRPVRAFIIVNEQHGVEDANNVAVASRPVPGFDGRPAIAVLPLAIAGGDRGGDDAYLAEGLAEDIIENLSSWRAFPVIARNSSFQFRDPDVDLKAVGREVGARYVVVGSLRRSGSRVRVAIRLIDALNGHEVVSHRAECPMEDLFEAQAEIARLVVGALEPELLRVERERAVRQSAPRPDSYDLFMQGLWHHYQFTPEHVRSAITCFRDAIAVDRGNAQAHAALAISTLYAAQMRWVEDGIASFEDAERVARRAVELDSRDPLAHFALGAACMWRSRIVEAESEMDEAIELNPSFAAAHAISCFIKVYRGRTLDALAAGMKALRLSPHDPRLSLWLPGVAAACFHLEQFEDAVGYARKALLRRPGYQVALRYAVAALGRLERRDEAAPLVAQLRESIPDLAGVEATLVRFYQDRALIDQVLDGLRRAGFE